MSSLVKKIHFQEHGDDRGHLVVMEGDDSIPFEIKRIYYIYDTKENVSRGFHAHHELEQVIVSVKGSCEMILDDGEKKESVMLDSPSEAVVIDPMIWHEMHNFSEDCVLVCLASDHYDESDYIRDYEEFKSLVAKK